MKKKYLSTACLLAGMAMFSACSNEDEVMNGVNEPVQTISMAVANTGDNFIGTRAAADRPLHSSEAKQSIDKVKVIIYKVDGTNLEDAKKNVYGNNKTIAAVKVFENWMNNSVSGEYNTVNGHGRQASWTLSTADLITTPGFYVAYAVGYNNNYDHDTEGSWKNFLTVSKNGTISLPVSVKNTEDTAKEIFAGQSEVFEITENPKTDTKAYHFNASITLHRQVAGAIGYFTNIPTKGNADHANETGTKLRLVASAKNTSAVFAHFNSDFKGTSTANVAKYIVNGNTKPSNADAKFYNTAENNGSNDAYIVYEVELNQWFTNMDSNKDGLLNEADDWENALGDAISAKPGSALAGRFLIPFEMVATAPTFQLQMLNATGAIIRYWNIRLPQTNAQLKSTVSIVNANGVVQNGTNTETNTAYSVVRNHLYTIGMRDGGDKPTQPGVNPDKPQDLNDETLILRVNDNWEEISHMEVD